MAAPTGAPMSTLACTALVASLFTRTLSHFDSGLGFSGAERPKAGRAFQRFDRPGTVTGAGLGLAIAMELSRRMGGTMQLSSASGEGSVMTLRLPKAEELTFY